MSKLFSPAKYLLLFSLLAMFGLAMIILPQLDAMPVTEQEGEAAEIAEYFQYRFEQMADANGEIPDGALVKALDQRAEMKRQQARGPQIEGIDSLTWTAAGPGNIGGRIRSILPVNASTVLIGSVAGGLWKTTNCCSTGTTWTAIDDYMANLGISSIIVDPTNANVMYAGTGEGFGNGGAVRGAGVFKSTDGGATWAQLSSTNNSNWYYVNRLAISPDGANLLAATGAGIYHSTDGGAAWTQRISGNWKDVKFDPTNSSYAVAAGSGYSWYTTSGGASGSWAAATGLPASGRIELAYAPSDTTIVYASVDQTSGDLYKSTDRGHTYTLVNSATTHLGTQGWYDNMVWVAPNDASRVVVGGIDMYQSTDGGTTLTQISKWSKSWGYVNPPSPHADHHVMVSIPGSNTAVLDGNDGGLYYTSDITTAGNNPPNYNNGWVFLNNMLGVTQFYGVSGNSDGVLFSGAQDNGAARYTTGGGSNGWTFSHGGDGGKTAVDPNDPNYFFGEYIYGQVYRSDDAGVTTDFIYGVYWNGSQWTCRAAPYRIDDACNNVGSFIAPILLDPNNTNRLYVGDLSLWRTDDAKTTYIWNSATGGPQWTEFKSALPGTRITSIAVAPSDSNVIWVGYRDGTIDMTTDDGANWTNVDVNISGHPGTQVSTLAIDKNNSSIVYAGFTGFGASRVWRTADGGTTWTDISSNLPQAPAYALAINPSNSAALYVGTEVGIYVSVNTGGAWGAPPESARYPNQPEGTPNGSGPANVATFDLQWKGGGNSTGATTLIAGTHGRGAFTTNVPTAATLVSFRAKLLKVQTVRLRWNTGSELAVVGFNIWRATKRDGEYKKLNADLRTAKSAGQTQGNQYTFRDKKVKAGKTYFYKLEIVRANGESEWSDLERVNVP